ncbi:substrate-binding domain-containing protein [Vibrio mediterranei]|uniref:LacI family DNA-binding transcriptional regulator n=1 Tax=Vibrio mediterranei TaxID=689 RepID=A0A3G4VEL6_9VIBR|nr:MULTISPECIES: substrate-binding domain-containing protein [Vibrio]AYV23174.1 LacI family DNA-binding transcriptional regulator [Vibrio mediterranei]EDL55423.1 transcriptional regulator [Vibrio mediterranei AK1]KFA98060.1 hypothetical protein HW45_11915 [Vibrio sp. ER1A]MCF4176451.1 substrate-binding domain-containing protein [Vibrio sp. McD22-P3]MCG9788473.1 substrate-binding domain-containing protein [Vibrio mediterranei]
MKEKKATIYDVARKAGVSPSTVSRYLNRTTFIAKDKVDTIEKAIFDLGFKPKGRKAQPKTKRNMKIGVVAPSFDTPYVSRILYGMDRRMRNHSYDIIIETTNWEQSRERHELQDLVSRQVDGIIVVGGDLAEEDIAALTGKIPTLLMCRRGKGILPLINVDNEMGGYLATNHLVQLGHKKIMHLTGPSGNIDSENRIAGYLRSLKNAGLVAEPGMVIDGHFESRNAFQNLTTALKGGAKPTAIFAANDHSAFGVIQALHQYGLRVPDDVSVIGFDDLPIDEYYIPRLTTVRQPFAEMGEIGVRYLLDLISGNKPNYDIPPVQVIIRDSTQAHS